MPKAHSQSEFLLSGSCYDELDDSSKKDCKEGQWSIEENQLYLRYLEDNKELFINHEERKKHRVFEKVSNHLRNKRTPRQCRSHHQKIMNKSKPDDIESAISYLRQIIRRKIKKTQTEKQASTKKQERTRATQQKNQEQFVANAYKYVPKVKGKTLEIRVTVFEGSHLLSW